MRRSTTRWRRRRVRRASIARRTARASSRSPSSPSSSQTSSADPQARARLNIWTQARSAGSRKPGRLRLRSEAQRPSVGAPCDVGRRFATTALGRLKGLPLGRSSCTRSPIRRSAAGTPAARASASARRPASRAPSCCSGLTSLLTDISSEMVVDDPAALPRLTLGGFTPLQFGVIDGLYQGAAAARAGSPAASSATAGGRHKEVATLGYGALGASASSACCAVGTACRRIGAAVLLDRIGKGIRTAPRDAMISLASAASAARHRVRRAPRDGHGRRDDRAAARLRAAGAGAARFDSIFLVSFCFALIGVGDPRAVRRATGRARRAAGAVAARAVAARRGRLTGGAALPRACSSPAALLGLATISDGFLYLALQRPARPRQPRCSRCCSSAPPSSYMLLAVPPGGSPTASAAAACSSAATRCCSRVYAALLLPVGAAAAAGLPCSAARRLLRRDRRRADGAGERVAARGAARQRAWRCSGTVVHSRASSPRSPSARCGRCRRRSVAVVVLRRRAASRRPRWRRRCSSARGSRRMLSERAAALVSRCSSSACVLAAVVGDRRLGMPPRVDAATATGGGRRRDAAAGRARSRATDACVDRRPRALTAGSSSSTAGAAGGGADADGAALRPRRTSAAAAASAWHAVAASRPAYRAAVLRRATCRSATPSASPACPAARASRPTAATAASTHVRRRATPTRTRARSRRRRRSSTSPPASDDRRPRALHRHRATARQVDRARLQLLGRDVRARQRPLLRHARRPAARPTSSAGDVRERRRASIHDERRVPVAVARRHAHRLQEARPVEDGAVAADRARPRHHARDAAGARRGPSTTRPSGSTTGACSTRSMAPCGWPVPTGRGSRGASSPAPTRPPPCAW